MKESFSRDTSLVGSSDDFSRFLMEFDTPDFRSAIADSIDDRGFGVDAALDTYFSEMRFGHAFLKGRLPVGRLRILEIGAGLGLLSIWLHRQGHEVVALEPAAPAFDLFETTRKAIWQRCGGDVPALVDMGAECLDPALHGTFDFIFSINVMEHVSDLPSVFRASANVLRKGGTWLNSCPNYSVPYEPHYAIPMVPFAPGLTRRLFARTIDPSPQVWNTLNFINVAAVRQLAGENGLVPSFEPSTLYSSLVRLAEDPEFLQRHASGPVGRIYRILTYLGLLQITRHLPVVLNTPMVFRLYKPVQE